MHRGYVVVKADLGKITDTALLRTEEHCTVFLQCVYLCRSNSLPNAVSNDCSLLNEITYYLITV